MAKNYFISNNYDDLVKVNQGIIDWFKEKQYKIESSILDGRYFIQAQKTGAIRTLLGANLAFQIMIYFSDDLKIKQELIIETNIGKVITNVAGAGITSLFMGGIPIFTGLANAGWAVILENELIAYIENNLNLKKVRKVENISSEISQNPSEVINEFSSDIFSHSVRKKAEKKVEEEMKQLENNLKLGIITSQQFALKKDALDDKIDEYEVEFLIEEKITQFQKAFEEGILDDVEYEQKLHYVHDTLTIEIMKQKKAAKKLRKIAKLKQALDDGILTQEEYTNKVAQL